MHNGADMTMKRVLHRRLPAIPDINGNNLTVCLPSVRLKMQMQYKHKRNAANKMFFVGCGLLGMETAHSLCKRNCNVTVIEFYDRLLPKQLDHEGAAIIKQLLEQKGLQFIVSESIASINKNERGLTLHCTSGRTIDAGTVIFSMGIKARTDLAKNAGLTVNRGIIINNYLQTSDPYIFAAGDPSEHNGICYGIWTASREQGKLAGLNMAALTMNITARWYR
jgi:nitrite reductase (NADH) large subunit